MLPKKAQIAWYTIAVDTLLVSRARQYHGGPKYPVAGSVGNSNPANSSTSALDSKPLKSRDIQGAHAKFAQ